MSRVVKYREFSGVYGMILSTYRTNRASFSAAELARFRGQWIAFNVEGTQIVASGATFEQADKQVQAAGFDPNQVLFEHVPDVEKDICLGSEEFR